MDSVASLLDEAHGAGLAVNVEGDRLVVEGPKSAEAVALRILDRKSDVLAALSDRADSDTEADEPIDWWQHISDEDQEYLLGPEVNDPPTVQQLAKLRAWQADRHPGKCFFCGGRTVHNPSCSIVAFKSVLPFGRFKGRRISDVPKDYLRWLLDNSTSLSPELRVEIEGAIHRTKSPPRPLHPVKDTALMNEPPGCRLQPRAALATTHPLA